MSVKGDGAGSVQYDGRQFGGLGGKTGGYGLEGRRRGGKMCCVKTADFGVDGNRDLENGTSEVVWASRLRHKSEGKARVSEQGQLRDCVEMVRLEAMRVILILLGSEVLRTYRSPCSGGGIGSA